MQLFCFLNIVAICMAKLYLLEIIGELRKVALLLDIERLVDSEAGVLAMTLQLSLQMAAH